MAKSERNVLTAVGVKGLQAPGMYADGGNLYLQIGPTGAKSWIFRYYNGKRCHMGLGPLVDVSLKLAREKAADQRELLRQGKDPILERADRRVQTHKRLSKSKTFSQCVDAYIEAKSAEWTVKHLRQWQNTLKQYAIPKLGNQDVADVDRERIMNVLTPIWKTKNETANRVRGRIELVLNWATVMGYRHGENPARWKGNLDHLLATPSKVAPRRHLRALPFAETGNFMAELRMRPGVSAKALEFCILNGSRTTEALQCRWSELDLKAKTWTIPAERMKSGVEHVVPLSKRAVVIITDSPIVGADFVFPGHKPGAPLSNMAMLTLLKKRMGYVDLTVHGFRSTFRDWAAEQTQYTNEVVEMALAHTIGDKTEAAYRRGQLLPKRRKLMNDWSAFCAIPTETNVVELNA